MSNDDQFNAAKNMQKYGGGFAASIGDAWFRADLNNQQRLVAAFPELFEQYKAESWGN